MLFQNDEEGRLVSPEFNRENDNETEISLRPKTLGETIGQEEFKENQEV